MPALAAVRAVGVASFGALGFAVLGLVRWAQAFTAVALGTLLPLGFISDVFVVGARMPAVLATAGDVLPVKHLVHVLDDTLWGPAAAKQGTSGRWWALPGPVVRVRSPKTPTAPAGSAMRGDVRLRACRNEVVEAKVPGGRAVGLCRRRDVGRVLDA